MTAREPGDRGERRLVVAMLALVAALTVVLALASLADVFG